MTAAHPLTFEVLAIGARGKVVRNRVRSTDARLAADQVRLEGLRVIACTPQGSALPLGFRWSLARPARIDVALFAEELAALLDAGLGMVDAMSTLAAKEREAGGRDRAQHGRRAPDRRSFAVAGDAGTARGLPCPARGRDCRERRNRGPGAFAATPRAAPRDAARVARQSDRRRGVSAAAARSRIRGGAVPARCCRAPLCDLARRRTPRAAGRVGHAAGAGQADRRISARLRRSVVAAISSCWARSCGACRAKAGRSVDCSAFGSWAHWSGCSGMRSSTGPARCWSKGAFRRCGPSR